MEFRACTPRAPIAWDQLASWTFSKHLGIEAYFSKGLPKVLCSCSPKPLQVPFRRPPIGLQETIPHCQSSVSEEMLAEESQQLSTGLVTAAIRVGQAEDALGVMKDTALLVGDLG